MLKNTAELDIPNNTESYTRLSHEYEIELSVNHFLHPYITFGDRVAPQEEIYPGFYKVGVGSSNLELCPALEISQLRN